jgi:dTMP kinase
VLLDVPPLVGLQRVRGRELAAGSETGLDRLEREQLDFHDRVRQGFRVLAESDPNRYLVLDATLPAERLAVTIELAVRGVLSLRPEQVQR